MTAALALVLSACATNGGNDTGPVEGGAPTSEPLQIVATTSILGDIVANLVQGDGEVEVLMPPGSDPHGFELSAAGAARLREADLVVANGLQLEETLVSALDAAAEDGARVFALAEHLEPIEFDWEGPHDPHGEDDPHNDDEDPHGEESLDPHVWHDPVRMADGIWLLAEQLAQASDQDAEVWHQRADAYAAQLLEVHEEVEEVLAEIPEGNRQLVTNHDAFGYLAARYDFEVLATVVPGASTDAETNPAAFAELIATVEEAGVPAVFSENIESDRLAEQLASEVLDRADLDLEVVELYSDALGEPGTPGETYLGMLRENAQRIASALS